MNNSIYLAVVVFALTFALMYASVASAQNMTISPAGNTSSPAAVAASNIIKNATAKVNVTASNDTTKATAKVNVTASTVTNNASEKANQTSKALENASEKANQNTSKSKNNTAENILNKTEDIGKKIAGGLGSLLGNASQKLKEGSK